jgi:hypothetical protein
MSPRRGISLLDLFTLPPGFQALLPQDLAGSLETLAVLDYSSTTSDETYIHHDTIQALAETLPALDDGWDRPRPRAAVSTVDQARPSGAGRERGAGADAISARSLPRSRRDLAAVPATGAARGRQRPNAGAPRGSRPQRDAATGAVLRLTIEPPHFFFGQKSKLGMTVDGVLLDHSVVFTPAAIKARGHGPD